MKYNLKQTKRDFDEADNSNFLFFWGHTESKNHVTKA